MVELAINQNYNVGSGIGWRHAVTWTIDGTFNDAFMRHQVLMPYVCVIPSGLYVHFYFYALKPVVLQMQCLKASLDWGVLIEQQYKLTKLWLLILRTIMQTENNKAAC